MKLKKGQKFADKHESNANVDEITKEKILSQTKKRQISCTVAFKIADELSVKPIDVGKAADLMEIKLVKCQLGLFGYEPVKKIVKPKPAANSDLEKAIRSSLVDGKLSCEAAWEIAHEFNISKMSVSAICEALKIKITPCQLGAF